MQRMKFFNYLYEDFITKLSRPTNKFVMSTKALSMTYNIPIPSIRQYMQELIDKKYYILNSKEDRNDAYIGHLTTDGLNAMVKGEIFNEE